MKNDMVVVFDMDETLGSFVQMGIFWDALQEYFMHSLTDKDFYDVLDQYPEFLRPNIFSILKYLKHKKKKGHCSNVYIYTNNQGPRSWASKISKYFEKKISYPLFEQIIAAFKVRNKRVEICRTTHDKTVEDFLKCTKLDASTKICFLDDQYHPLMEHERVNYINIKPYSHDIPFSEMIERFIKKTKIGKQMKKNDQITFTKFVKKFVKAYSFYTSTKSDENKKIDQIISKKIMFHLQDFFKGYHSPKTLKKRLSKRKKRRKRTHKIR